jgi:hypothetical protein
VGIVVESSSVGHMVEINMVQAIILVLDMVESSRFHFLVRGTQDLGL